MTLHPEILWAQRSDETAAEKVANSLLSHELTSLSNLGISRWRCRMSCT